MKFGEQLAKVNSWSADTQVVHMSEKLVIALALLMAIGDRAAGQQSSPQPAQPPVTSKTQGSKVAPPSSARSTQPASKAPKKPKQPPDVSGTAPKSGSASGRPPSGTGSKPAAASKAKGSDVPAAGSTAPQLPAGPKPVTNGAAPSKDSPPDAAAQKKAGPAVENASSERPADSTSPAGASQAESAPQLTLDQARKLFTQRREAWRDAQEQVESKAAEARLAKPEQFESMIEGMVELGRHASIRLTDAVIPALFLYETEFEDKELTDFLIKAVDVYSRRGRLDEAAAIAKRLVVHGVADPQVNLAAGLGALEDFEIDDAKKYLGIVKAAGPLAAPVETMLKELEVSRDLFEHERQVRRQEAEADDLPRIVLVTTRGDIEIELYENDYPNAVASLLHLVTKQFYDGLPFYKVVPSFGAIVGSLYEDGTGGPGYEIAQVPNAEYPRLPTRGAISLINAGDGACGSRMLISYSMATSWHLRRTQPVIGRVVRGMSAASELNWVDLQRQISFSFDRVVSARVIRARPHKYEVVTTAMLAANKYNEGIQLAQAGKFSQAEGPLLEALKIAPRDRQVLDAIALVVCQQERLDEGAKYLRRAVDADPHSPEARHHLGRVLLAAERLDAARRELQEAITLKPDFVDARIDLAELLQKEGKIEAAIEQYNECLKYQPDGKLIQEKLRALTSNK